MYSNCRVLAISALKDNYIWMIHNIESNQCVVVDPGEALPVLTYVRKYAVNLSAIVVTHYHKDHINGIKELKNHFPELTIYGSALEVLPYKVHGLSEGNQLWLLDNRLFYKIYEVPGHTLGHIAYYSPDLNGAPAIFTGDTLFSGGCGRLFEGSPDQLYHSLQKLKQLPCTTRVYCAHEYTLTNLKFALWLEPDNTAIRSTLERVEDSLASGDPIKPSHLKIEKLINPFLRCDDYSFLNLMQKRLAIQFQSPILLFTHLRKLKDNWTNT